MQNNLILDPYFGRLLSRPPQAIARLAGDAAHPGLFGIVKFYQLEQGVLLSANFSGLPMETTNCPKRVLACTSTKKGIALAMQPILLPIQAVITTLLDARTQLMLVISLH